MSSAQITAGMLITAPVFPEPVKVLTVKPIGRDKVKIEAVGQHSRKFYDPILSHEELAKISAPQEERLPFSGRAEAVFLYLEANRIRHAFQFDTLYGVSVSQIDPLPHQIEAVYHYILKSPRIRFLLADDPGAGKTIMAGLLLKELKYRGLVNRTLIIVPGHLKGQWLREMKERFGENFIIVDRGVINASWGQNIWLERPQLITSLDFAKQEEVLFSLKDSTWDLVIVDEAHKLAAYRYGEKVEKTERYKFGEQISALARSLLFLTATPHRGDPENFRLFLDLLQPGFFADTGLLAESIQNQDNPLFLRRLKEDLKNFDGAPLFPPRHVETVKYRLSDDEKLLYNAVTNYVQQTYNKALQKEKRNVAFALTILQRRLASSTRAIRRSLERRKKRLEELYQKGQILQETGYSEDYLEDLEENQRWQREEELLEKLSSAETLEELQQEINKLGELLALAKEVEKKEVETKLTRLRELLEQEKLPALGVKLLLFTESRETMEYLSEKLSSWGYRVALIHGGMNLDARIRAEHQFKNEAQIMVATEAAGEGINLQFCWLMVNYDLPWNPNRLEQRMGRIHRYGQRNEVHIYNLVAADTLEGRIMERLFEKLKRMREHLGSDRVFDVIGDVLAGTSLRDLIMDAIAKRRSLEEILAGIDLAPDEEAIRRAKEASMEALATRHIDLSRIAGEQRRAKENRLVPEYIEKFFLRAAKESGLKIEQRQDGYWRVPSVPFKLHHVSHSFKIKYGEVMSQYLKVSFEKDKAKGGQAEYVTMGHPLMEALLDDILSRFRAEAAKGALFYDPDAVREGLLWFMSGEIRDGRGDVAGRRLFCLYQDKDGAFHRVNPSLIWDLKPSEEAGQHLMELEPSREEAVTFALDQLLLPYREELLRQRKREAALKEKYGLRSLDHMILESEAKLSDYEIRKAKGENIPEATVINERRHREDLARKKTRLQEEIQVQTNLYPAEPELLAVVRVLPYPLSSAEMRSSAEVEKVGMEVALAFEREQGRNPEDVSAENLGYDIRSVDPGGGYRYIEVKARAGSGAIALTPNEWVMAGRLQEEHWLYVVENAAGNPALYTLQNPAARLSPQEEVSIVRYIVKDWKEKASMEARSG